MQIPNILDESDRVHEVSLDGTPKPLHKDERCRKPKNAAILKILPHLQFEEIFGI